MPPVFFHDKPLKDLCTLGIGGPAKKYVEVKTIEEMKQAILACQEEKLSFFILGKGSNCLFDDRGFNGCVIHNKIDFIKEEEEGVFVAGGGYSFSLLGTQTARKGWKGLEFASGIPATVGGAVFMNAGANGSETQDTLVYADFITEEGTLARYRKKELEFSYRYSSFQKLKGAIVTAAFKLEKGESARQKQLEIISYRQKTQPYGEKSAGCIFRNPPQMVAGRLIDEAGLKGFSQGDAEVSMLHGNFLINRGSAYCQDFLSLIETVKNQVKAAKGIELEAEVRIIPYEETLS
jgi:UDP-N-acetylmuramate dehydrogenase